MSVEPEAKAARWCREWLLLKLPAKVAELNLLRAAVIRAPFAGPYVFAAGTKIGVRNSTGTAVDVTMTTGSRTTAQCVTEINTALGATVCSADSADRLVFTATVPPSAGVDSSIFLQPPATGTGCLSVFGFDAGGVRAVNSALAPPTYNSISDGRPIGPDTGNGFMVYIDDRHATPVEQSRRDMHVVGLDLAILRVDKNLSSHRSREHIQACLRAVREVLLTGDGKTLGHAGEVQFIEINDGHVFGAPFSFGTEKDPGPLYDGAELKLQIQIHERPATT